MTIEELYETVREMIISSTKQPKYTGLSTVKIASLLDSTPDEIEDGLKKLLNDGKLRKSSLSDPPYYNIYLLP